MEPEALEIPLVRPYGRLLAVGVVALLAALVAFGASGSERALSWLAATSFDPERALWALRMLAALPLAVAVGSFVALARLASAPRFSIRATPEGLEFPAAPLVWRGGRELHLGWREIGAVTPDPGGSYVVVHTPRMVRRIPRLWLPRGLSAGDAAVRIAERGRRYSGIPDQELA